MSTNTTNVIAEALRKIMELRELDKDLIEIQTELDYVSDLLSENPAPNPRDIRLKTKADLEMRKEETEKEINDREKSIQGNIDSLDSGKTK